MPTLQKIILKIKSLPKYFWIFLVIMAIGSFLRTYHFHDWLRFSMDQSRDALIISDVISGQASLPLLGPIAGGTFFHLGPAYYYFSLLSAQIFGNYPDAMAYPSLFFAILVIPLLFLFLREYFTEKLALVLIAIMSLSYYFIEASRFSSNPNLIPFFTLLLLYAFLQLIRSDRKRTWRWLVIVGIAVGIGIQLHTTLLILMPVFTFLIFMFYDHKRILNLKQLLFVIVIALSLNAPQFISEFRTSGQNRAHFFDALVANEATEISVARKAGAVLLCQAKANVNMLSNIPVRAECSKGIDLNIKNGSKELLSGIEDKALRRKAYEVEIAIILSFFMLGYLFFIYYYKKEKVSEKKNFLLLVLVYNFCALLLLMPVVHALTINYFNILFFIPFIFLGLILKFLSEKFKLSGEILSLLIICGLFFTLVIFDRKHMYHFQAGLDNNLENSNLRWAEDFAGYFNKKDGFEATVYLSGENKYLNRYFGPMNYMLNRQGMAGIKVDASQIEEMVPLGENLIYIKNAEAGDLEKIIKGYAVVSSVRISPVDIYILKRTSSYGS